MNKGFTLIELMIAMGILVVLLLLSVTIFSRFVMNERREIAERSLQEDIRFALELFLREARTGYASTYVNLDDSPTGIVFRNQNQECVAYQLRDNALQRATASGTCDNRSQSFSNWEALTGRSTRFIELAFKMPAGATVSERPGVLNRQGFVTIILKSTSTIGSLPAIELETTITSRQFQPYGT